MAVTQVAFEIPPAIQEGIDKGMFFRFGGVIRDQAGHIVTHLKEVELPKAESSSKKLMEFAKNNKYILIGTASNGIPCHNGIHTIYLLSRNGRYLCYWIIKNLYFLR